MKTFIRHRDDYTWEGVPLLNYKEEAGTHFKQVTRQVLSERADGFSSELRYFEVAPGGYSTLERHQHAHMVLIGRGSGRCLVGEEVFSVDTLAAVMIPPMTWHQFRAGAKAPLGFFCIVDCERDRSQLPTADDLRALSANPIVGDFIRV